MRQSSAEGQHVCNVFFDKVPLAPLMMSRNRFMVDLHRAPNHRQRPVGCRSSKTAESDQAEHGASPRHTSHHRAISTRLAVTIPRVPTRCLAV
jgi:hypothetical protein